MPLIATVLVTLENGSATDETVELLANGVSLVTLQVVALGTRQSPVQVPLPSGYGSTVTLEAVSRGARRAQQSVLVGPQGTAQVTLRIR